MFTLPAEGPLPEITVQNERLLLRPFAAADIALIEEASGDEFIPTITTVPATFTAEAGLAFIERQADRLVTRTGWSLAIVDRSTDRAVGQIGLWLANFHHGRAEIGYWVAPSFRRRGYQTVALTLLTDWAFQNLALHRLTLFIEPWNVASIKTAEAGGYEREGLFRNWQVIDGSPRDMWSYARLRSSGLDGDLDDTPPESIGRGTVGR